MIEQRLWDPKVNHESIPQFPCPICEKGLLESNEEKFLKEFDAKSKFYYEALGDYNSNARQVFTGILNCNNKECKEPVIVSGHCIIKPFYTNLTDESGRVIQEGIQEFDLFYNFDFFYPNLKFFSLKPEVPSKVKIQMNLSFSHFFRDLDSCANRIRSAIEILMDEIGADKTMTITTKSKCPINHSKCSLNSTKEKTIPINKLHGRISNYRNKQEDKRVGDMLLAIKIIGNTGSHSGTGSLKREDIIDAYRIIETVFEILFVKREEKDLSVAKEILDKNKPRSN